MMFIFFLMLITAIILYVNTWKYESGKWAVFFIVSASFTGLSQELLDTVVPYLQHYQASNRTIDKALFSAGKVFEFIGHYATPYGILMFSLVTANCFTRSIRGWIAVFASLPIAAMLLVTSFVPEVKVRFMIGLIWITPYVLISCFLMVVAFYKEKNTFRRRDKKYIVLIVIPPTIAIFALYDLGVIFFPEREFFRYAPIMFAYAFALFIYFSVKNGTFGVRLRFEQQVLDTTMRAIMTSSSILHHAIKNKITTNQLLAERILASADLERIHEDTRLILVHNEELMNMVRRIQKKMEDISIVKGPCNLRNLLERTILSVSTLIEQNNFKVTLHYEIEVDLLCDCVHLQEVFINIIKNALEAKSADRPGTLQIRVSESKKHIRIAFEDNGVGMSKPLQGDIFTPFVTTKKQSELNYGLGLTYCYLVVQKHGGEIHVESEEGSGSTFVIQLPKSLVTHAQHISNPYVLAR